MKLELKHLAPYLPYKLKWSLQELKTFTMTGITKETMFTEEGTILTWPKHEDLPQALFPILRPLSDINKDIDGIRSILISIDGNLLGFRYVKTNLAHWFECYGKTVSALGLPYLIMTELIAKHYDVFNLIEQDLAIDINTLKS